MHGIDQKLGLFRIREDLKFCGKSLFHGMIISQEQQKGTCVLRIYNYYSQKEKRRGPVRDAHPAT